MQTDEPGGQFGISSAKALPLGVNLPPPSAHPNPVNLESSPLKSSSIDEQFPSAGRGIWARVPDADWNDWRWQLRNRITSLEALEALMPLTPTEREGVSHAGHHLAMAITPYFFNLIDVNDPTCPIRAQEIPRAGELV